jgi:hypothetical protein
MPNAELVTAARFRRHVAMAADGVVCIGVLVVIATFEVARFDLRV